MTDEGSVITAYLYRQKGSCSGMIIPYNLLPGKRGILPAAEEVKLKKTPVQIYAAVCCMNPG